jgi:hypothetical protein
MSELLPGVPPLHPRLRNSARNLVLLSGPDLRQWLYDLGQRLDDLGRSAGELRSTIDRLRAVIITSVKTGRTRSSTGPVTTLPCTILLLLSKIP